MKPNEQAETLVPNVLAPNSSEAEEAVLGSVLINPDAFNMVSGFLTVNDFYIVRNGWVWAAMVAIDERGDDIDYITVVDELRTANRLEEVGGNGYITSLINATPTHVHVESYARIVERSAIMRRMLKSLGDIASMIADGGMSLPEMVQRGHDMLTAASRMKSNSGFKMFSEFASENLDRVEAVYNGKGELLGIPTGLQTLDEVLCGNGWQPGKLYIIAARPGMGKCLARGTEVLRYDGQLTRVEEIKVGDLLMGSDSKPRRVLSLGHGYEQLYWIHQQKGISYKVNGSHILSLKRSKNGGPHRHGDILNISVNEILGNCGGRSRGPGFFSRYKGYKAPVDFPEQIIPVPPYFLGLWLGDGKTTASIIYTADEEVATYLSNLAVSRGEIVSRGLKPKTSCIGYTVRRRIRNSKGVSLQAELRKLGVLGNKHIPQIYLANSRSVRLQLLAGLIDSDGNYQSAYNTYEITTILPKLAKQIKFLADSLGYRASLIEKMAKAQTGLPRLVYRVRISGDMTELPILIARKKPRPPAKQKNTQVTGIRIEKAEFGEFYGFELDGDGLFLLEDMTVTHNTALAMNTATIAAKVYKKHVVIISKEMTGNDIHFRVMAAETNMTTNTMKSAKMDEGGWDRFTEAIGRTSDFSIAVDDGGITNITQLELNLMRLHREWGIDIVFVDYLQLLYSEDKKSENRNLEVSVISRKLKELSLTLRVPIVALSQLSRKVEERANRRPQLSDLRDSGSLEQDADLVMFIYRDDYYNPNSEDAGKALFIIAKQRDGETVMEGLKVGWSPRVTKFFDINHNGVLQGLVDDWNRDPVVPQKADDWSELL